MSDATPSPAAVALAPLWSDEELAMLYMPVEDERGLLHYPSLLSMFRQICARYDAARATDAAKLAAAQERVPDGVLETLKSGLRELQSDLESSHTYMRKHPEEVEALSNAFEWLERQRPQAPPNLTT